MLSTHLSDSFLGGRLVSGAIGGQWASLLSVKPYLACIYLVQTSPHLLNESELPQLPSPPVFSPVISRSRFNLAGTH